MSSLSTNSDMFLSLLTTQLKNQNPLDPMDATEFTSQLATYSALEQQVETNDKLENVISQLSSLTSVSSLSFLGATAEIDSSIGVMQDGSASWNYELPSDASSVTLTLTNADGEVVYSGTGETSAGAHSLSVDTADLDQSVADGSPLQLTVQATGADGSTLSTSITSFVKITALDGFGDGAAYEAGGITFSSDDIVAIHDKAS